jgi:O-acetyl-ADP-ribose deacetylase (regulator of RNase III)
MHELLVGEALIVSTENARVPWLVVAPTMRVPMRVRTSINAYLAMKAILTSARNHVLMPPIRIVAIPGLGTGVGQMSPEICAEQMWQAFREVVLGEGHPPENFAEAQKRHVQLNRTGMLFD